ncbi:hypothetical protein WJX73_006136 [Symbiochloris irregularis]|uniref:Protein Asterix n=1 Tax=Symbiochloris irregularis TaxID=706552 RepID=A0AAW1P0A8_9CHLO
MGQPKVSGDPRRPAEVHRYVPAPISEPSGDLYMLGAFLFGAIALFFKSKLAAWLALIVCLSCTANSKVGQADTKGLVTAFSFCLMSMLMTYIPVPQREPPVSTPASNPG